MLNDQYTTAISTYNKATAIFQPKGDQAQLADTY